MLKKLLKEIMLIVAGKQAEGIISLLDTGKYVNEFIIAKKLDITINQTRNILYKISDCGLISFIRKKDKRKGWYTYFWKIEILKSLEFLQKILIKRIGQINNQIKSRETKQFYVCKRCNIEFSEENALLHNFTCNECGNIFVIKDNIAVLKELNKNLDKLKKELELVDKEIEKEKKGRQKKAERLKAPSKKFKRKSPIRSSKKQVKSKKKIIKRKSPKKKLPKKKSIKKKATKKKRR